jgi:RimJ/RimL family protein N-acetyltransferase
MNVQEAVTHLTFEAHRSSFAPVINVLVTLSRPPDDARGTRFVIRAADGTVVAESGTNWRSDEFAEVFVHVELAARGRGLGKSVVSACTAYLLDGNLRPLYVVDENNTESVSIAQALGYTDTGARELAYTGSLKHTNA